jgi:hypothetical protein
MQNILFAQQARQFFNRIFREHVSSLLAKGRLQDASSW